MANMKKRKDFTEGPIFTRILLFVLPLVLTGMIQHFYSMADSIVVGKFSGDNLALAAVGSTANISGLLINIMIALSAGAGIIIAQKYGAKDYSAVSRTAHTAITLALCGGVIIMLVAFAVARPALIWMGTKPELLDKATLYLLIICGGIPASSVYNFGASILRSVGDSKTSLYILSVSGLSNVFMNLLFVIVFDMSIVGVALATVISNYVSAVWVVIILVKRRTESYGISPRRIKLEKTIVARIMRLGLPIVLQTSLYGIANIIIATVANTFETHVISAKTIATNMDGIIYVAMDCFSIAAMTFIGQNYGANKARRMNKALLYTLFQVTAIGILIGQVMRIFQVEITSLFIENGDANKTAIIAVAKEINKILLNFYFICGIMNVFSGALKALGASVLSTVGSLIGVIVRVIWTLALVLNTKKFHTVFWLYFAYIVSWLVSLVMLVIFLVYVWKKLGIFRMAREEKAKAEN